MSETVGERIRRVRLAQGRTHRDVARQVGIGYPYLSKVESGIHTPSEKVLLAIAAALDTDPDELAIVARRLPGWAADALADDPPAAVDTLRAFLERPR